MITDIRAPLAHLPTASVVRMIMTFEAARVDCWTGNGVVPLGFAERLLWMLRRELRRREGAA